MASSSSSSPRSHKDYRNKRVVRACGTCCIIVIKNSWHSLREKFRGKKGKKEIREKDSFIDAVLPFNEVSFCNINQRYRSLECLRTT